MEQSDPYDKLNERFPELTSARGFYGFSVTPAWFKLLENMCEKLERLRVESPGGVDLTLNTVKSKFGGLRVYLNAIDHPASELIYAQAIEITDEAEHEAHNTCSGCGLRVGSENLFQKSGWHDPECRTCRPEEENEDGEEE
jgi:hypothetical protein